MEIREVFELLLEEIRELVTSNLKNEDECTRLRDDLRKTRLDLARAQKELSDHLNLPGVNR